MESTLCCGGFNKKTWTSEATVLQTRAKHFMRHFTCEPGILAHIFADWWQPCRSFGIALFAANLGPSSGSWCRLHGIYLPWASPDRLPDRLWRRSLSYQTGTCLGPKKQDEDDLYSHSEVILKWWGFYNIQNILFLLLTKFNNKQMKNIKMIYFFSYTLCGNNGVSSVHIQLNSCFNEMREGCKTKTHLWIK